jgi:hypothetical protein
LNVLSFSGEGTTSILEAAQAMTEALEFLQGAELSLEDGDVDTAIDDITMAMTTLEEGTSPMSEAIRQGTAEAHRRDLDRGGDLRRRVVESNLELLTLHQAIGAVRELETAENEDAVAKVLGLLGQLEESAKERNVNALGDFAEATMRMLELEKEIG